MSTMGKSLVFVVGYDILVIGGLWLLGKLDLALVIMVVTASLTTLLIGFFMNRGPGVRRDELSERQDQRSFALSWVLTITTVGILGSLDYLGYLVLPAKNAYALIVFVMAGSFWTLHFLLRGRPRRLG